MSEKQFRFPDDMPDDADDFVKYIPEYYSKPREGARQVRVVGFDPDEIGSADRYKAFKKGGRVTKSPLQQQAESVRGAGRHGDELLIHVNDEEYAKMCEMFGDPIINPETGIPEWGFFGKLWKGVKKIFSKIAPILPILSFIPGLNFLGMLGTMIGSGLSGIVGTTASQLIGNAVAGAIPGALSGDGKGALLGAIGGAASGMLPTGNSATVAVEPGALAPTAAGGSAVNAGKGLGALADASKAGIRLPGIDTNVVTGAIKPAAIGQASMLPGTTNAMPSLTTALVEGAGKTRHVIKPDALKGLTGLQPSLAKPSLAAQTAQTAQTALSKLPNPGTVVKPEMITGGQMLGKAISDKGQDLGLLKDPLSVSTQRAIGRGTAGALSGAVRGDSPIAAATGAITMGGLVDDVSENAFFQDNYTNPIMKGIQGVGLGAMKGADVSATIGGDPVEGMKYGAMASAAGMGLDAMGFNNQPAISTNLQGIKQANPTPEFQGAVGATSGAFTSYKTKTDALNDLAGSPDQRPVYDALQNFTVCDMASDFGACMAQNWDIFNNSIQMNAPHLSDIKPSMGNETLASKMLMKKGGDVRHGQSDDVEALLSVGEYVIPADVVSALGNGSTDAGATQLDNMLMGVRKNYRKASPKNIPRQVKSPLEYMKGVA